MIRCRTRRTRRPRRLPLPTREFGVALRVAKTCRAWERMTRAERWRSCSDETNSRLDNILEIVGGFWQRPDRRLSFSDDPQSPQPKAGGDSRGGRVGGVFPWQVVKSRGDRPGIGGVDESGGGHPPAPRQGIGCPYFELTPRAPPMSTVSRIPPVRSITSRLRGAIPSNSGDGRDRRRGRRAFRDVRPLRCGIPRLATASSLAGPRVDLVASCRCGAASRSSEWPRCRRWFLQGARVVSVNGSIHPMTTMRWFRTGASLRGLPEFRRPTRRHPVVLLYWRSRRSRKRVVSQALVPLGAAMAVLAVGGCGRSANALSARSLAAERAVVPISASRRPPVCPTAAM